MARISLPAAVKAMTANRDKATNAKPDAPKPSPKQSKYARMQKAKGGC